MADLRSSMLPAETFGVAKQLADLFGGEIDKPTRSQGYENPMYGQTPLKQRFFGMVPEQQWGMIPDDFGVLQNQPQYWGSRMTLPQSGGDQYDSYARPPLNPMQSALQQAFYGEMITRGYPVVGGMPMFGRGDTFKPVGFGQR